MPSYSYKAKNGQGAVVADELTADTEAQAFDQLDRMGLFPLEIREKKHEAAAGGMYRLSLSRIRRDDVVAFSRQLADLLKVGVTINKALATLSVETPNRQFAAIIQDIKADVSSGTRVSEALGKFPKIFSPLYVNMVRAGETGGFLEEVLERVAGFMEQEQEIRARVKAALAYPTLLSVLAIGAVIFLMVYFIPTFSKMFDDLGGALPLPTLIVMGISNFIRQWGLYFGAGLVVAGFLFLRALDTDPGRLAFDRFRLRIPLIGTIFSKTAVSRFARILGTLLRSGVNILQALDITREAVGNKVFAEQIRESTTGVKEGLTLAETLKKGKVIPDMVVGMIAVGEETGNVEEVLLAISDNYDKQVDRAVRTLVALMEPMMLVVMGVLVGGIVISMILPIFSIQGMIK
ncbi:MAG: type II secretion system F family protein [Planctomycetota bacterium]|jgi:type II secretory pathway component PulF